MNPAIEPDEPSQKRIGRLKMAGLFLTVFGIGLFGYLIYSVGLHEIYVGIVRFGLVGFAVILTIQIGRICSRTFAWKLSIHEPYTLRLRDAIPAVIIGEAMSSTIPLGIVISGTSKALAVRKHLPMVPGLSSVATENLFYSLVTSIFLIGGAITLLRGFTVDESLIVTIDVLVVSVSVLLLLGILMVVRQWHFASEICERLYQRGWLQRLLENGRLDVRLFENLIYDFYRRYPKRFFPICLFEAAFHVLGITEVYFILDRISGEHANLVTAFLLESVSRLISILFKLVPFVIGVDEAGAQFVGKTVALGAGVGVTLAIIRKGRILFWTAIGWILIAKRGLSIRDISKMENG